MDKGFIFDKIKQSVINCDEDGVQQYVKLGLDTAVDPLEMIRNGLKPAIDEVGEAFSNYEIFLPELISSADAFKAGVEILSPIIEKSGAEETKKGLILLGTVKGDIHDLGKNIIGLMYSVSGFDVVDLGVDVSNETFIGKIKELKPDVLGLSSMLTNTREMQKDIISLLKDEGLRDNIKVIIGGAVVNQLWADEIEADAIGLDAGDAISKTNALLK